MLWFRQSFVLGDIVNEKRPGRSLVAGICGSLRPESYTLRALSLALQGARSRGATTELIDLRNYQLEFCDGSGNTENPSPDLLRLRSIIREAQGIIWATPEYHGSFSGVLKNALDLMSFDEFSGKMIGLVGVAGGAVGATNALNALRTVGRTLGAWVIPHQASIASVHRAFDERGALIDPKLHQRIHQVGCQVARFAYLHHSKEAREFMELWETAQRESGTSDWD